MDLPFSRAQFFDVMAAYNVAVWPAQALLLVAAFAVVWAALRRSPGAGRWASAVLAFLWVWMAVAYHWAFFTSINKAAWAFGAVSLLGAAALAWFGVRKESIVFGPSSGARAALGWSLVTFALLVYPAIGALAGHDYPFTPTFGLPCPTTIFTIGVLLLTTSSTPRWVYVAPVAWTVVGASAAVLLGVYQDLGLVVAGAAAVWAMSSPAQRRGSISTFDAVARRP